MPLFERGRRFQFQNSTFTDAGRRNLIHSGTAQTGQFISLLLRIESVDLVNL